MSQQLVQLLFEVVGYILSAIYWIVMVWVVLSWILFFVRQTSFKWRYNGAFNILTQLDDILSRMTGPFLRPFRKLLPAWKTGGIDWSPMLLLLTIYLLQRLAGILYGAILIR